MDAILSAYRAVRDDGRGEDDVILLGDFDADDQQLTALTEALHVTPALRRTPTNTLGDRQSDNILYSRAAAEFTGRAGVLDLIRQYNLTVEEALVISDHMPIWAEFIAAEATADGLARRPATRH